MRRAHLIPYLCDFPGCSVRKGDKLQIMDHLHRKHRAPKDQYKVLTPETLKRAQMQALGERGISRKRIVEICNAKHVDDLNDGATNDRFPPTVLSAYYPLQGFGTGAPVSPSFNSDCSYCGSHSSC